MHEDYADYLETRFRATITEPPRIWRLAAVVAVLAIASLGLLAACSAGHAAAGPAACSQDTEGAAGGTSGAPCTSAPAPAPLKAGDCAVHAGSSWSPCTADSVGRYQVIYVVDAATAYDFDRAVCGTGLGRYDTPGTLHFICLKPLDLIAVSSR